MPKTMSNLSVGGGWGGGGAEEGTGPRPPERDK